MNTPHPKKIGCVPSSSFALKANVLTEYYQRHDIIVELDDGSAIKSGHLVADGRRFNFRDVYNTKADWGYLYITQLSYLDDKGNHQVAEVTPRNPHPFNKGASVTNFGYVTKINGKRWGVLVTVNWRTGDMQIIADQGTPIVGALIQLI